MDTQGSIFLRRDAIPEKHSWYAKIVDVQEDTVSFEVSLNSDFFKVSYIKEKCINFI